MSILEEQRVVVDAHSHIFNAEDLPIDGFIKRLSPFPSVLTAVLSTPFDKLAQWAAPGSGERQVLKDLIEVATAAKAGLEAAVAEAPAAPVVSDRAVFKLFADALRPAEVDGLEHLADGPAGLSELNLLLATLPQRDLAELRAWAEEYGDEDALTTVGVAEGLEGLGGALSFVRKLAGGVKRVVAALQLVTRHRYEVAAQLSRVYKDVVLYTPALVDFDVPARDQPSTDIREQIAIHSLVSKLSMHGGIPGSPDVRIHPFVGFDPFREIRETALKDWDPGRGLPNRYRPYSDGPDGVYRKGMTYDTDTAPPGGDLAKTRGALNLVRQAIENCGFVGVKLYPPAGFQPLGNALRAIGPDGERLDAALRALYTYCQAMDVPILTHANDSNGFADHYGTLAGPAGWELALKEFPKLRLCFGHFGHMTGIGNPASREPDSWPWRFVDLIDGYPFVYADVGNSHFPIDAAYRGRFLDMLQAMFDEKKQQQRVRRLMYGSDWWMNTLSPAHEQFVDSFRQHVRPPRFGSEVATRFMGYNALCFLGLAKPEGGKDLDNLNRQRLVKFYDDIALPAWL